MFSLLDTICVALYDVLTAILYSSFLVYKNNAIGKKKDKFIYWLVMSIVLSLTFNAISFGVFHIAINVLKWEDPTNYLIEPDVKIMRGYVRLCWFLDCYSYIFKFAISNFLVIMSIMFCGFKVFWKNFYIFSKKMSLILIVYIIFTGIDNIISSYYHFETWSFMCLRMGLSIIKYIIIFKVYKNLLYTEDKYYSSQTEKERFANSIAIACLNASIYLSLVYADHRLLFHARNFLNIFSRIGAIVVCVIAEVLFIVRHRKLLITNYNDKNSLNKYNSIDEQVQFLNEQLKQTKDDIESVRRYRHDLRHHLLLLDGLMQRGEFSEAKKYIKELSNQTETLLPTQYCSNVYVNSILSAYAKKAKDLNIELLIKTAVPSNINFDDVELSTLFANLFENAIEACKYLTDKQKKYIIINCEHKRSNLVILVENPCRDDIVFKDGLPQTNKEHGGRGTLIVKQIVENHQGLIQYNANNKIFSVKIIVSAPRT